MPVIYESKTFTANDEQALDAEVNDKKRTEGWYGPIAAYGIAYTDKKGLHFRHYQVLQRQVCVADAPTATGATPAATMP